MSVYDDLGLDPIINVSGAVTRLGGAPMPPAVLDAFRAAAAESVPLDALHGAASRAIAELTGAEAGLVTAGAAAALTLGAAAILTGYDPGRMERLPHCAGFPHEFVVARDQRNGYDHAVRAAGARLIEVGMNEVTAGAGVRRVPQVEVVVEVEHLQGGRADQVAAAAQDAGRLRPADRLPTAEADEVGAGGQDVAQVRPRGQLPGRVHQHREPGRVGLGC